MTSKQATITAAVVVVLIGFSLRFIGTAEGGVYPDSSDRLWPGGVVPYQFDPNFIGTNTDEVLSAMQVWVDVANVSFVVRTNEADFLRVRNAPGTSGSRYPPPEGYRSGTGGHTVFIRQNLALLGSVTQQVYGLGHEMGHVLGLYHTHQRQDRENFVMVDTSKVTAGSAGNFSIANNSDAWPRLEMDIDSIMSYGLCTFSICGNCPADLPNCAPITLLPPLDTEWAGDEFCPSPQAPGDRCIGHRNHLSRYDMLLASFLYPPSNWVFVDILAPGPGDGSFHDRYIGFTDGYDSTASGGTTWIVEGGTYASPTLLSKRGVVRAPLGALLIGE